MYSKFQEAISQHQRTKTKITRLKEYIINFLSLKNSETKVKQPQLLSLLHIGQIRDQDVSVNYMPLLIHVFI